MSKFKPKSNGLPPMATLLRMANCDESDLQTAIKKWQEKPPDNSFAGILDATILEG